MLTSKRVGPFLPLSATSAVPARDFLALVAALPTVTAVLGCAFAACCGETSADLGFVRASVMSPRRRPALNSHEFRTVDEAIQNQSRILSQVRHFRTPPALNSYRAIPLPKPGEERPNHRHGTPTKIGPRRAP